MHKVAIHAYIYPSYIYQYIYISIYIYILSYKSVENHFPVDQHIYLESLFSTPRPALQQRMENEILQSFGARREMPARRTRFPRFQWRFFMADEKLLLLVVIFDGDFF